MSKPQTNLIDDDYDKLTQIEHALLRPDSYVGEVDKNDLEEWIFNDETDRMEYKMLNFSPAAVKVFDEIVVNARDATIRDNTVDKIKVNVDMDTGMITVFNNGSGIPVKQIEKWDNQYLIEGIFGDMMSGSNFKKGC